MIRAFLIITTLLAAVRADASRYTLKQLIDRAEAVSPSVESARATVDMRRAQLLEIQLHWLPEGETAFRASSAPDVRCMNPFGKASFDDRLSDCKTTNVVDLERGAPGTTLGDLAPFAGPNLFWYMQFRQPFFTSLKIESAIKASRGGIGVAEADVRSAELDVAVTAVRLYTQIKNERVALATLETSMGVLTGWSTYVEGELNGKNRPHFTESDGIRMRLMLSGMRSAVDGHKKNLNAALAALRVLTSDPQADVDEADLSWQNRDVGDQKLWRDLMMEGKPEIQYARAGMRYYKYWHRLQLTWAAPDVALVTTLAWGYSPTFDIPSLAFVNLPAGALGGGLGFGLHEPLDLAGKIMHARQVRHDWQSQETRFQLGLAWWTVEIDKAWLDLDESRKRLELFRRGEKLTQGWYALVDEQLAMGLAPDGRDFVEVILSWSGFRMGSTQAMADSMVNLAVLRRLAGQPILRDGVL